MCVQFSVATFTSALKKEGESHAEVEIDILRSFLLGIPGAVINWHVLVFLVCVIVLGVVVDCSEW